MKETGRRPEGDRKETRRKQEGNKKIQPRNRKEAGRIQGSVWKQTRRRGRCAVAYISKYSRMTNTQWPRPCDLSHCMRSRSDNAVHCMHGYLLVMLIGPARTFCRSRPK